MKSGDCIAEEDSGKQSPLLYKREQGNYSLTLMKSLYHAKNIASMRNKFYHGKMSRGRKLKPLPSRKVEVKSRKPLIYKAFSDFVHRFSTYLS